jgi:hypothetical protein
VDYRVGSEGLFTPVGGYSDPEVWGPSYRLYTFGHALDNQSDPVFIRIAALAPSVGSGSRDTLAIDNLLIAYTAVPEPSTAGSAAALGLAALGMVRTWRKRGYFFKLNRKVSVTRPKKPFLAGAGAATGASDSQGPPHNEQKARTPPDTRWTSRTHAGQSAWLHFEHL